jgi:hypothetical protein
MRSVTFIITTLFAETFLMPWPGTEEQPGESVPVLAPADKNASA